MKDRRQATVDRRRADAKETAERVAELVADRRSEGVHRAVEAERAFFEKEDAA